MTHVVHPYSHRLGILRDWKSKWFPSGSNYKDFLRGDILLREYLTKRLRGNYISEIIIERSEKALRILIRTSRPGMIIGRSGDGMSKLKKDIESFMKTKKVNMLTQINIDVEEVASPDSTASIVAQMVAEGLEKRLPFRRVLKQSIEKIMAVRGVKGAKIALSGRLGGAEMARKEKIKKGGIPLQTFRADIDFSREKAYLTYGVIGIKVWIYKGDIFEK